jgi:phytoene synthase
MFSKLLLNPSIFLQKSSLMAHSSASNPTDTIQCEELMRGGSKSFFAASRVLPKRVRNPAIALYAFCRLMDDIVDEGGEDIRIIQTLKQRLDLIYEGKPLDVAADRALSVVVAQYKIPKTLLEALLEGFEWDKMGRRYNTIEDLYAYAARVAGTVGAMMSLIMGTRQQLPLTRACELGLAMQLTNIARDVGEDAKNGRLYLPLDWMRAEGIDPESWLKDPKFTPQIARVVDRLLKTADMLYQRSQNGISQLPRDCRAAIYGARLVYAQIGRQIEKQDLDSVSQRAIVSSAKKKLLMLKALSATIHVGQVKTDLVTFREIQSRQGDGACFAGNYSYQKGALKAVKKHAPLDEELHRIVKGLQEVQSKNFYRLRATTVHRGHYYHSNCMSIDIHDDEYQYRDLGERTS